MRPGDGFKLSRNAEAKLAGAGNSKDFQTCSQINIILRANL